MKLRKKIARNSKVTLCFILQILKHFERNATLEQESNFRVRRVEQRFQAHKRIKGQAADIIKMIPLYGVVTSKTTAWKAG
jgi:hypothetical protein